MRETVPTLSGMACSRARMVAVPISPPITTVLNMHGAGGSGFTTVASGAVISTARKTPEFTGMSSGKTEHSAV